MLNLFNQVLAVSIDVLRYVPPNDLEPLLRVYGLPSSEGLSIEYPTLTLLQEVPVDVEYHLLTSTVVVRRPNEEGMKPLLRLPGNSTPQHVVLNLSHLLEIEYEDRNDTLPKVDLIDLLELGLIARTLNHIHLDGAVCVQVALLLPPPRRRTEVGQEFVALSHPE